MVGEEGRDLTNYVMSYFQDLFTSNGNGQYDELLWAVPVKVTSAMNESFTVAFSDMEMKAALDQIGDLKALGPDGMPAVVFKKYCHLMGRNIIEEVRHVLEGGEMSAGWNDTHVVLIPKVKKPSRIKDLRPISLCNVLYKITTKVLANRLKVILPLLISEEQSAFVPGWLITDNVLVAYECGHAIRTRKRKNPLCAVKLDMMKAYDRVDGFFLNKC